MLTQVNQSILDNVRNLHISLNSNAFLDDHKNEAPSVLRPFSKK